MITLRRAAVRACLWILAGSSLLFALFALITAYSLRGDLLWTAWLCGLGAISAVTCVSLVRMGLRLREPIAVARTLAPETQLPEDVLGEDVLAATEFLGSPARGELTDLFVAQIDRRLAQGRPNPGAYAPALQLRTPALVAGGAVLTAAFGLLHPQTNPGFSLLLQAMDGRPAPEVEPLWSSLVLDLTFPEHTGRAAQSLANPSGVLRVPAGTQVGLRVAPLADEPLHVTLVTDGHEPTASHLALERDGSDAVTSFVVRASGSFRIAPVTAGEREVPAFPIELEQDHAPEVELLPLPAREANAAETDVVTLQFRARDDFGLAAAELVFELPTPTDEANAGDEPATTREVRLPLSPPPPNARVWNHHYKWDLSSLSVEQRVDVSYWLEVRDNDPGLGLEPLPDPPGKVTRSAVMQLHVEDAESRHEENLMALRELRDAAVDLLASRMTSPALSDTSQALLPRDRLFELRSVLSASAMFLGQLATAIESLSVDTLAPERDVAILAAIHERLVKLHREETALHERATFNDVGEPGPNLPQVFAGLVRHNVDEVRGLEDEIIRLDDLVDTQIMEQIESLVARLQASQQRLVELLEALKAGDESVRAELELLHQRVLDDMRRLAEARSMLRKEVGSEFLNADAFAAMEQQVAHQDVMEQVRRGDVDGALQRARDALSEIQQLRDQVQGKLADTPQAALSPEEQARLELLRELSRIQDAQTGVRADSRKLHQQRRQSLAKLELDKQRAAALSRRVDDMLEKFDKVKDARLGREARSGFEDGRQALKRLSAQLNQPAPNLLKSAEQAQEAFNALDAAAERAQNVADEGKKLERLRQSSARVRDDLRKLLPAPNVDEAGQQQYQATGESQQGLRQRADALLGSEKSGPLPKAGRKALEQAMKHMEGSSQNLGQLESADALHEQQMAIEQIKKAIDSLRKSSPPPPTGSQQNSEASTQAERDRSLRDAVVEAMKEDAPEGFGDPVKRYYEELLQ